MSHTIVVVVLLLLRQPPHLAGLNSDQIVVQVGRHEGQMPIGVRLLRLVAELCNIFQRYLAQVRVACIVLCVLPLRRYRLDNRMNPRHLHAHILPVKYRTNRSLHYLSVYEM
jgi:hypothetical protein